MQWQVNIVLKYDKHLIDSPEKIAYYLFRGVFLCNRKSRPIV